MIDLNSLSRPWNRICDGAFLQSATRTRMLLMQSRSTSRWHSSPSDIERIQLTTLLFVDSRISRYDNYHVCRRSFHGWTRVRSPHLHFKSIRSSLINVRHNFRTAIPDDFHFHILMIHDIFDVCFLSFLAHIFFTVIEEDLISIIIQSAIGHMIDNDQKSKLNVENYSTEDFILIRRESDHVRRSRESDISKNIINRDYEDSTNKSDRLRAESNQ